MDLTLLFLKDCNRAHLIPAAAAYQGSYGFAARAIRSHDLTLNSEVC